MHNLKLCNLGWSKVSKHIEVNYILGPATKAQRSVKIKLYSFFKLSTRWWWVVNTTPRPLSPPVKEIRYPLYRRLGGPLARSGQVLPGFDPRTV
jgi:hypothetical protein